MPAWEGEAIREDVIRLPHREPLFHNSTHTHTQREEQAIRKRIWGRKKKMDTTAASRWCVSECACGRGCGEASAALHAATQVSRSPIGERGEPPSGNGMGWGEGWEEGVWWVGYPVMAAQFCSEIEQSLPARTLWGFAWGWDIGFGSVSMLLGRWSGLGRSHKQSMEMGRGEAGCCFVLLCRFYSQPTLLPVGDRVARCDRGCVRGRKAEPGSCGNGNYTAASTA